MVTVEFDSMGEAVRLALVAGEYAGGGLAVLLLDATDPRSDGYMAEWGVLTANVPAVERGARAGGSEPLVGRHAHLGQGAHIAALAVGGDHRPLQRAARHGAPEGATPILPRQAATAIASPLALTMVSTLTLSELTSAAAPSPPRRRAGRGMENPLTSSSSPSISSRSSGRIALTIAPYPNLSSTPPPIARLLTIRGYGPVGTEDAISGLTQPCRDYWQDYAELQHARDLLTASRLHLDLKSPQDTRA